jgi:predicted transcriptional regulator
MYDGSKSEVNRMRDKSAAIEEGMALTNKGRLVHAGDVCQEHVTTGEE